MKKTVTGQLGPVDINHVTLDELHHLHSCYNVSFKTKQSYFDPKMSSCPKPNQERLAPKPNRVVLLPEP